jgi:Tol biopolymer transport system component
LLIAALALVTLIAAVGIVWALRPQPPAPEMRLEINTPPTTDPASIAISPDGQKIVFVATSESRSRLWLRSLDSVTSQPLTGTDGATYPFWSPDSRSIGFFADSNLKRIDTGSGSVQTLAKAPLARGGAWNRDGTILFSPQGVGPIFRISAAGGEPAAVTRLESTQLSSHRFPQFLPDGRRVAVSRSVNGNTDIWLLELGRGILSRFTFDAALDSYPIWSPDGSRIVFQSNRKGNADLYQKPVNSAGSEEPLLANPQSKLPWDWSADGRFLLHRSIDPRSGYDLWVLPMDGDRKPFPVVQTDFDERDGQFSPDGKWIAYQSNESGRFEIYVQPFPGLGAKAQISTNGGAQVRWRSDGRELFYVALDERLMAVPVRTTSDGKTIDAVAPVPLFATRVGGAVQGFQRPQYMVSPDGQRFLMSTVTEEAVPPITVILNWKAKP